MTLPRKGTLARSQYLLDEAFQSIVDDAGKQMFVAGRNLFPGSVPESISTPAIAYTIAPPANLENSISRGGDTTSLFGFEIAVFHGTRTELIDLVDVVLGALRVVGLRAYIFSGEAHGPGNRAQINLYAETI